MPLVALLLLFSAPARAQALDPAFVPLPLADPMEFVAELDAEQAAVLAYSTGYVPPVEPPVAEQPRRSWWKRLVKRDASET